MSRRDPKLRLRHMLDHAVEAMAMLRDKTRPDLDQDRVLGLALVRLLEIVGEAANSVDTGFRADHPEIPWTQVVGLRNRLIHGYDAVDFDVLWSVVHDDLPTLSAQLARILDAT